MLNRFLKVATDVGRMFRNLILLGLTALPPNYRVASLWRHLTPRRSQPVVLNLSFNDLTLDGLEAMFDWSDPPVSLGTNAVVLARGLPMALAKDLVLSEEQLILVNPSPTLLAWATERGDSNVVVFSPDDRTMARLNTMVRLNQLRNACLIRPCETVTSTPSTLRFVSNWYFRDVSPRKTEESVDGFIGPVGMAVLALRSAGVRVRVLGWNSYLPSVEKIGLFGDSLSVLTGSDQMYDHESFDESVAGSILLRRARATHRKWIVATDPKHVMRNLCAGWLARLFREEGLYVHGRVNLVGRDGKLLEMWPKILTTPACCSWRKAPPEACSYLQLKKK